MHDDTFLLTLVASVSWLVSLAMQVTLLVVALTTVRRVSTDASSLLAISAGIDIVSGCVRVAAPVLIARVADGSGAMLRANAVTTLLGTLLHLGAFGLLVAGIVRLAARRTPSAREPD